jgi:hypothetical protein
MLTLMNGKIINSLSFIKYLFPAVFLLHSISGWSYNDEAEEKICEASVVGVESILEMPVGRRALFLKQNARTLALKDSVKPIGLYIEITEVADQAAVRVEREWRYSLLEGGSYTMEGPASVESIRSFLVGGQVLGHLVHIGASAYHRGADGSRSGRLSSEVFIDTKLTVHSIPEGGARFEAR